MWVAVGQVTCYGGFATLSTFLTIRAGQSIAIPEARSPQVATLPMRDAVYRGGHGAGA